MIVAHCGDENCKFYNEVAVVVVVPCHGNLNVLKVFDCKLLLLTPAVSLFNGVVNSISKQIHHGVGTWCQ